MVATPTFVAPIADRLTGDRISSDTLWDTRLIDLPLWGLGAGADARWRFYKVLPRTGLRKTPASFVPDELLTARQPRSIGGDEQTAWVTAGYPGPVDKLYKLNPKTWAVRASRLIPHTAYPPPPTVVVYTASVGGNSKTVWLFNRNVRYGFPDPPRNAHDIYTLYRLDGESDNLPVVASKSFRWLESIGGDDTVAWGIHRRVAVDDSDWETAQIIRITPDLEIHDIAAAPLRDEGHWAIGIAGSEHNIYLYTLHQARGERWLHWISPETYKKTGTYEISHSYGPFVSAWSFRDIGGN